MRIAPAVFVAAALAATGCSKLGIGNNNSGGPTAPSGPPAAGSALTYSAVGASDVMGIGSTTPCFLFEDCNGTGYVWVAARQLRSQGYTVTVGNLGIPAAVISRSFQELGAANGRTIGGNLIEQEMPFVSRSADVVTVFTGANDVNTITAALGNGAGSGNQAAYIDDKVAAFAADYVTLINGIRARASQARIIVLNLPNMAALPYLASASLAQKQAAQRASVRMTTTAINTLQGVTVIDLMCDSRLYSSSIYSSDGFHPNDSGYAIIGAEVVRAVTSPSYGAPRASCTHMTLY
ncbi:MAG TPA: SGNH/GDSL hydrolase family protein [Vicinamibacterales bacterium]|nr:SGNH/GDSL hydrolase family protein [Vicinamibacterales bacterium]